MADDAARLLAALRDPETVELMVNDDGSVYRERAGAGLEKLPPLADASVSEEFLARLLGRREPFGAERTYGDFSAVDGSRVHVLAPPVVRGGLCVTVRKRPSRRPALGDLVDSGTLTEACGQFLRFAVESNRNLLIAGGASSGKTTLLNALCGVIEASARVLVIEDTPELTLDQPHVVYMRTQEGVTLRELVTNTLRMRPDRVIVGETRGPEAGDMLQAMNVGQEGVMSTLHANSAREALQRLETLILLGGVDMPLRAVRSSIATALDLVVFMARAADGRRRVIQVSEITGMELESVSMSDLFKTQARKSEGGGLALQPTGVVPKFYDLLREAGFEPPLDFFTAN